MDQLLKKHAEKIKYLFVGGFNTLLDFALLFLFVALGIDKIVANYFSTGIAMVFSFFANKSFTFKNKDPRAKRQFALFIIVTVAAMWIIQPIVIWFTTLFLQPFISNDSINLFIAKIIATVVSLIWNYLFYSRVVFKKPAQKK